MGKKSKSKARDLIKLRERAVARVLKREARPLTDLAACDPDECTVVDLHSVWRSAVNVSELLRQFGEFFPRKLSSGWPAKPVMDMRPPIAWATGSTQGISEYGPELPKPLMDP